MSIGTATCPRCGAPVKTAPLADGSGRVVLEAHESARGAGRYAVWDDGTARAVTPTAEVLAFPVHQCTPAPR